MVTQTEKPKRFRRTVDGPAMNSTDMMIAEFFDRTSSQRYKLKPDASKTLYLITNLMANEFALQRKNLMRSDDDSAEQTVERRTYLRHAESALRDLCQRLHKSFDIFALVTAMNTAGPQWHDTAERHTKQSVGKLA